MNSGEFKEVQLSEIRHKLRTPVNHIIGYSELLIEEIGGDIEDDLNKIHSGGRELLKLINDFFDEENFDLNKLKKDSSLVKLRTPVNQIIGYSELLLEEAADNGKQELLIDLRRVYDSASQWLMLMEKTLLPLISGDLKIIREDSNIIYKSDLYRKKLFTYKSCGSLLLLMKGGDDLNEIYKIAHSGGHVINHIETINDAWEILKNKSIDIILLCFNIINFNLKDFLSILTKNINYRTIPVIIIAQLEDIDIVIKSIKIEVDGFIYIPFDKEQINILLTRQLNNKIVRDRITRIKGRIMVVDDDENNRDVLTKRLKLNGHEVTALANAEEAIELLYIEKYDVLLLDMIMPGMNGDDALAHIKSNRLLQQVSVIMISGLDQIDKVVRCIEMGAEDYLPKPFNSTLLNARINAALEKKQLKDQERIYLKEIQTEKAKTEKLLLNILPAEVAKRLKLGDDIIADNYKSVSVLFSDLVGFTKFSKNIKPRDLVILLNKIFTEFDEAVKELKMEKIKTIGDAYMAVAGLPKQNRNHAYNAVLLGNEMLIRLHKIQKNTGLNFRMRVGIHSGPVTAGIIGKNKFIYDLWGDTVNVASRMESQGIPDRVQITEETAKLLNGAFSLEKKKNLNVKGRGLMSTFLVKY